MRLTLTFVLLSASLSSGCSVLSVNSGKDLSVLESQEEVRKDYGKPVATGVESGKRYDDFRSHRKVLNEGEAAGWGMGWAMTFGIGEFWAFPIVTYDALKAIIAGQNLRFYYDESGKVKEVWLNGFQLTFMRKRREERMNELKNSEKTLPDGIKVPDLYPTHH